MFIRFEFTISLYLTGKSEVLSCLPGELTKNYIFEKPSPNATKIIGTNTSIKRPLMFLLYISFLFLNNAPK
jgi:hypothetical protein